MKLPCTPFSILATTRRVVQPQELLQLAASLCRYNRDQTLVHPSNSITFPDHGFHLCARHNGDGEAFSYMSYTLAVLSYHLMSLLLSLYQRPASSSTQSWLPTHVL